ncbi:MAG: helix-turn-helix domain-containing protein [Deltaproteobacteria bacterium]|nr:helix-turn-helix domain-containing protein [Deltaproteobacteria bacterium]
MKKCRNCGATDSLSSTREARPLDSLPAVIVHRLKVTRCAACGAESVSIPRLEELHEVVAKALVQRPGRLAGPEVRYLRKWMGWSGRDFAEKFELTPEHVSRVENGHHPISAVADKLLRVLVLTRTPTPEYSPEDVLTTRSESVPFSLGVAGADERWQAVA